ncbi:hypothetical protein HWV62_3086 [Athelia sp. TMB]|nr:hypothetical protein HWV62_3086 [Athelia sp. TMB]
MSGIPSSSSQTDLTGKLIDHDRLQLIRILGSGGYGVVYLALDTQSPQANPKHYAVKCIREENASDSQCSEVILHMKLSSNPNILTIHRVVRDADYTYLVLDLCTGGDLCEAVRERRALKMDEASMKTVILQIIDAVSACHDAGVFHRDIKLENFLCDSDGDDIRLADFGLSTASTVMPVTGAGTLGYLAPECSQEVVEKSYSPREADVWALGVLMFVLINGQRPWEYAGVFDDRYQRFLSDPDSIMHGKPMSHGVHELLKKIFLGSVESRINLSDLRAEFERLDTIHGNSTGITSSSAESLIYDFESDDPSFDSFEAQTRSTNGAQYGITIGLPLGATDSSNSENATALRARDGAILINFSSMTTEEDDSSDNINFDEFIAPETVAVNTRITTLGPQQELVTPSAKRSGRFKSIIHRVKAVLFHEPQIPQPC